MSARRDAGDFWSRRRAAVEAEQEAERAARLAELQAEEEAKLAEKTDAELLADLDLPEPEAMDSTEQVQSLLKSAVPQRLKTRALRRLWRLNPVLANVDGLVDYGEDFTDAAMVMDNMQTAYQVGKGMLKAIEWESPKPAAAVADLPDDAQAPKDPQPATALAEGDTAPDAAPTPCADSDGEGAEAPARADAATDQPAPAKNAAAATYTPDIDPPGAHPAPTRRMRFRFDTVT